VIPVFIHGAGCTNAVFDAQLRAFPTAHAPKLPGHGAPGSASSVAAFADAVGVLLDARRPRDVILCGSSMGGAIALELVLRKHPAIGGAVLLGSGSKLRVAPAIIEGLARDFEATAQYLARLMYADPTPERIAASVEAMRVVGADQTLADFRACDAFDVTERLAEIDCPLLLLTGERDQMTPPKYARDIADRVASARVRILPGAGHLLMVERPAETNDALRAFVLGTSNK
jgi:pimeloyl-ACP methyl ester carboxylesterase